LVASPKYTAIATMVPDLKRNPTGPNEVSRDSLIDPAIVETQVEMLKSQTIALSVIDKLSLSQDPELVGKGPGLLASISRALGISAPHASTAPDVIRRVAAASFSRMLKVSRSGHSYLAEIAFTSVDPVKAALIANAVVDAYIQERLGANFVNAERSSRWMQQRLDELAQQSANAKKELDEYKAANHLDVDANGEPAVYREKDRLAASLDQARTDISRTNERHERLADALRNNDESVLPDAALLDWINDPDLNRLRDAYRATQSQARAGSQSQSDDADEAAKQREAIWNAVQDKANAAENELKSAHLREAAIAKKLDDLAPQVEAAQQKLDKLKQLEGTYQAALQRHDSLQNRFARVNEFVQQQSLPFTEAAVVSRAAAPLKPSYPKVALTLLLAALAGCTVGVAGALGLEYFDRTVRRPDQIENGLGLRALGSVHRFRPRLSRQGRLRVVGAWRSKSKRRGTYLAQKINEWLSDGAGEALRYVEVALSDNISSRGAQVLAVISPNSGEGKTVVALGLAILAARCGKRVLLVDADARKRSLTRVLQPGQFAAAGASHKPSYVDGITREDPGFSFLGVTGVQQSNEVIAPDSLRNTLEQIREQYDYVIVDTPALKSHVDVFAAARFFDTFIMLAEWKRTRLDDISRSLLRSTAISNRLLGVLINTCPHKHRDSGVSFG
jgi:uncharacterized protein involved in exopolysaccharide biosynthesis/Mrp family chromosome partitioning ATPase